MPSSRTIILSLSLAIAACSQLQAQVWPRAARHENVRMWHFVVTLPDGTHLIALNEIDSAEKDTYYWYRLESLLGVPEAYPIQFPVERVSGVYDGNGNGIQDVFAKSTEFELGGGYLMDAFTSDSFLRDAKPEGGYSTYSNFLPRSDEDLDGDGIDDVMVESPANAGQVFVVYGDREKPWMQQSVVNIGKSTSESPHFALALGMLSGSPCIVRGYYKWRRSEPHLQLLTLNLADLRARADTVRTEIVNEVRVGDDEAFGSVTLRGDDVWWLYRGSTRQTTCAKVTLEGGVEIRTSTGFPGQIYPSLFWGQGGRFFDGWPRVMDPMRPIITEIHATEIPADSSLTLGLLVWTIHDVHSNPRGEVLGQAFLSDQRRAAIYTAVVVPDLDGDGKEDIVVEHQYEDTVSKDLHIFTDVFLTTHILPVSVADSISADMASSTTITATRESGGWRYLHSGTCGEDAHEYPVYNVRGEVACTVRLTKSTGHGFLEPSTPLPPGSYWAVIGSCVVRL